jgi:DNA gyrase/topoisomerase IV subunit A
MRGRHKIEKKSGGKNVIVITEIPYQVNKAKLVEKIAELVKDKKIEGITDLRDESDRDGIRVGVNSRQFRQCGGLAPSPGGLAALAREPLPSVRDVPGLV